MGGVCPGFKITALDEETYEIYVQMIKGEFNIPIKGVQLCSWMYSVAMTGKQVPMLQSCVISFTRSKQVTTKISKMSDIMIRARHCLSLRTLHTIYNALIYPYLTYCNILWASAYSSTLRGVYKIQKKIVRIMTSSKYRQESRPLFLFLIGLLKHI